MEYFLKVDTKNLMEKQEESMPMLISVSYSD